MEDADAQEAGPEGKVKDLMEKIARAAEHAGDAQVVEEPVEHEVRQTVLPSRFVDLVLGAGESINFQLRSAAGEWLDMDAVGELIEQEGGGRVYRLYFRSTLGDPATNKPGKSHTTGRRTEAQAAKLVAPRSGTQRAKVLAAFIGDWNKGGDGLIDEDVAARTDLNLYSAAPRRHELVEEGWLRDTGRHGKTKLEGDSIKWELSPEAIEKLNLRRR